MTGPECRAAHTGAHGLGAARARQSRGERGAVAVETALLTPLMLVILLGIIEIPMLIRDYVAVTTTARVGVRVASASPDAGPCTPNPADETPCPAGQVPQFAQLAADAIARSGTALPKESIRYILVFKANADGYPGTLSSLPTSCAGISQCVAYTWRPAANAFRYSSGTWQSSTVNACFPANLDSVGVQVVADHAFLSGLLGSTMTMTDHVVMNFEPLPSDRCASGRHP